MRRPLALLFAASCSLELLSRLPVGGPWRLVLWTAAVVLPLAVALVATRGRLGRAHGPFPLGWTLAALGLPLGVPMLAGLVDGWCGGAGVHIRQTYTLGLGGVVLGVAAQELAWRGWLQRRWDEALRRRTGREARWTVPRVVLAVTAVGTLFTLAATVAAGAFDALGAVWQIPSLLWAGYLYEVGGRRLWLPVTARVLLEVPMVFDPWGLDLLFRVVICAGAVVVARRALRDSPVHGARAVEESGTLA